MQHSVSLIAPVLVLATYIIGYLISQTISFGVTLEAGILTHYDSDIPRSINLEAAGESRIKASVNEYLLCMCKSAQFYVRNMFFHGQFTKLT